MTLITIKFYYYTREVLKACMSESGMKFDEKEVHNLAKALFDDAVKVSEQFNENKKRRSGILKCWLIDSITAEIMILIKRGWMA